MVVSFIKDDDCVWLGQVLVWVFSLLIYVDWVDDVEVFSVFCQLQVVECEGLVLMYCKYGNNCIGLFVVMYCIVVQGWDKQVVLEEMQYGGFGDEDDMCDVSVYVCGVDVDGLCLVMVNGECSLLCFVVCYVCEWMVQVFDWL